MRSVWRWSAAVLFLLASIVVFTTLEAGSLSLVCNSLYLVCATLALSMPPGVILAWLLIRTDLPGRRVVLVLLASMLFVPLYLQAAGWEAGFGLRLVHDRMARSASVRWLAGRHLDPHDRRDPLDRVHRWRGLLVD